MKKVFLLIVGVASFATMQAQTKFGLKAGANFSNLTGDAEGTKMKVGFNAGAFVRFAVAESFTIQPELVYSGQGAKMDSEGEDVKLNISYLNIPILAQYHFKGGFNVEAGPQIGIRTGAKVKAGGESADYKDYVKSTDFSLAVGAAYTTTANVGFNARYNIGLGNIAEGEGSKVHNSVIQVGVYYLFGGGGK